MWGALTACGGGRRFLNNPEYNLAFGPPIEFKGDAFTGRVTSMQNPGLCTIYGKVDTSGKVSASVRGNYVSIDISERLFDGQGSGGANVLGKKSCTEF